jgi:hypothetical protein
MDSLPRWNRTVLSVTSLKDIEEEKAYWLSESPEQLEAVEVHKRLGFERARSRAGFFRNSLEADDRCSTALVRAVRNK